MGANRHAKRRQELAGEGAGGNARRGLAGAGALEDVADVFVPVLEDPRQVGVTGARQVHRDDLAVRVIDRPRVHPHVPVLVIPVGDEHRDRAAEGVPVADAGADLDGVGLDLHPAAAAMAELAAGHVAIEPLAVELETGRHALDDGHQSGAVRFAGGREVEARHRDGEAR